MHRPGNVDRREAFREILAGLEELAAECPIVFPVHPRTRKRIEEFELKVPRSDHSAQVGGSRRPPRGIVLTAPLGYLDFLCLMKHAAIVVTDSGGIQEETTCLGVPCVTVRENTERPVTVESGTNIIAGTSKEGIKMTIRQQLNSAPKRKLPPYWDGHAAARIIDVLSRARKMSAAPASS
jgi:UDP-N-acetylglucosamine 2-epimerase (non-hydrolysing)